MHAKRMSKQLQKELLNAVRERYSQATKREKYNILNEFVQVSGYHRKYAIRLFGGLPVNRPQSDVINSNKVYDEAVKEVLIVLWETADRICGKRLKAIIPNLMDSMERHGHLKLETLIREKILSVSASTIDRVLRPMKKEITNRRRNRTFRKVGKDIVTKTSHDWENSLPGYLEIDFVVHGGGSMSGEYLHSLVATDVCSGWTESVALLAREQSLVTEGLDQIQNQMPIPILGINSDNDSAFINETLNSYCKQEKIIFTHSRAHHSNDQAWIEQKNGAVIRKIVGHDRFSGIVTGQAMAQLYQAVRLYVNYFQPSFKLRDKIRIGAKVKKKYNAPATPCDRLLFDDRVGVKTKEILQKQKEQLDPVELLHRIRQGQSALAFLSAGKTTPGPDKQSLDQFLSQLPKLWKAGEVRPTHRKKEPNTRHWRTRVNPFEHVWTDIMLWLQSEPDCTAKTLFMRLKLRYPDTFADGHLRTLQRRVKEWRHTMAHKLIFTGTNYINDVSPVGNQEQIVSK